MTTTEYDQTAAARIRDAAIDLFGRQGFGGTTVRQIAQQANVSPALVIYHFGDKEAVRRSCDQHVIDQLFTQQVDPDNKGVPTVHRLLCEPAPQSPPTRYLARLLTEPGDGGNELWDKLAEGIRAMLEDESTGSKPYPDPDRNAQTQVMLAAHLSLTIFAPHIARGLGATEMDESALTPAHASLRHMLRLSA